MEAPFPSHQSLARYAVQHLDLKLLEALLERLSRELEAHLSSRDIPEGDPAPLYLMDTTGLAYRSKDRFLRFRRGEEVRRVRGHARLLALVRWERERRWLLPWGGVAGRGYAPDPQLGGRALRRFAPTGGWLLADAGFDGKEVWEALRGEGLRPVIRLRGGAYLWGSFGRPWRGRFWSSSPTALGSFSPFCRCPLGTRRFTRQALFILTSQMGSSYIKMSV